MAPVSPSAALFAGRPALSSGCSCLEREAAGLVWGCRGSSALLSSPPLLALPLFSSVLPSPCSFPAPPLSLVLCCRMFSSRTFPGCALALCPQSLCPQECCGWVGDSETAQELGAWSVGPCSMLRGLCISECVSVQVCESLGPWVCGSIDLWVYVSVNLWVCGFMGLWA